MREGLLETIRSGQRKQDAYDPAKYKYSKSSPDLPGNYTHMIVIIRFGLTHDEPVRENNFIDGLSCRKMGKQVRA